MNTIYDTILWLQSQATAKQFPIVEFSADTDMITNGWLSLTSINQPEIVVKRSLTGLQLLDQYALFIVPKKDFTRHLYARL